MRKAILVGVISLLLVACILTAPPSIAMTVPHQEKWGIYFLDLTAQEVDLLYSSPQRITTLRLNHAGNRFVFSQPVGGDDNAYEEIFTLGTDGQGLQRLTENNLWDIYPAWSPDDMHIAFLSFQEVDLDIYIMDANGNNVTQLFDSGSHDADIHWLGNQIAFTADSRIWIMNG